MLYIIIVYISLNKPFDLLNAIITVESNGNNLAFNNKENAAGCLQIRPIMINDVNRILSIQKSKLRYSLSDRWDCGKSIDIFYIFQIAYNSITYEQMARRWNGGPTGDKKKSTIKYWGKIKELLK